MRVWSKVAFAMAAGAWFVPASFGLAEDKPKPPAPKPKAVKPADEARRRPEASKDEGDESAEESTPPSKGARTVKLKLVIGGLGADGCDVEVKPGNPACRFKKQTGHVGSDGVLKLEFKNVEVRSADRNCTFAITMREAGQPPKTVQRGFRMVPSAADSPGGETSTFVCSMSSPSQVARIEREGRVIR
jgi:hypothetical protein